MLERLRLRLAMLLIDAGSWLLPPVPERTPEQQADMRNRVMREITRLDCHERRNGHDSH